MADHDSEPKRPRPPIAAHGVMTLLERWVSDLERDAAVPAPHPEPPRPRNRTRPSRLASESLADELAAKATTDSPAPVRPRPHTKIRPPAEQREVPEHPILAAREELRVNGLVVTLPPEDARVVLEREGRRLFHRGTVSARGPCAPTREELLELGLTGAQARALEFVLAWFALPFDHVACEPYVAEGPRWGVWSLSGEALVEGLERWKRRDPTAFEARLGRLGIDLIPPSLKLLDPESGHAIEGRKALQSLAADARLLATLAQAGRERGAQLAQLEYIIERVLRPLLKLASLGEAGLTPRALALLLHAELRAGRQGVERLLTHLCQPPGQSSPGAGEHFAADLQSAGRSREATEVRRILSSPELAEALS